jgi:YfiR/HmsC-like
MCLSRPKSVLAGLARLSLLVTCTMPSRAQTQADEYRVKAGFIFHFAQFVEWPAGTFSSSAGSITFCTLGEDPFHGDMESLLRGKAVAGKSVRVLHLKQVQDSKQCHVLFLDTNDNQLVPSALAIVKNLPILTVGESDDFLERGGMIRFSMEDRRIRFEVNQQAAEATHLKVSARLLLLATKVIAGY